MSRRPYSSQQNRRGFRKAVSAGFTPSSLSGLVLWTRSDLVSATGANVDQWTDKSGNGNHLVSSGANRPVLVGSDASFGGRPSLTWDGAATTMHTTGTITLGPSTYFMAVKSTVGGYLMVFKDDTTDYWFTSNTFSSFILRGATSGTLDLSAGWGANANARTLVRRFDGTVAGTNIRINGADQGGARAGSDQGTGTTSQTLYVGSNQTPGAFMTGSIAEIIVYGRSLSDPETQQVESYLRSLYGYY